MNDICRLPQQPRSFHVAPSYMRIQQYTHPYFTTLAVESPERSCFCIDVTCDNLLDAVKQTVEQETVGVMKRREVELVLKLREAVLEEQQLAAKTARFDCE